MTSDKKEDEKFVTTNDAVETSPQKRSALLFGGFELTESVKEKDVEATEPIKVGIQTEENFGTTVVHYEPKMKFLKREKPSENGNKVVEAEESISVELQTQQKIDTKEISSENEDGSTSKGVEIQPEVEESKSVALGTQEIPTIIYYEPEMKFLITTKGSGSVTEVKEPKTTDVQTELSSKLMTIICSEPEMKPLRKDKSENQGVLFNNEAQIKEIQGDTRDKSMRTEPETLNNLNVKEENLSQL